MQDSSARPVFGPFWEVESALALAPRPIDTHSGKIGKAKRAVFERFLSFLIRTDRNCIFLVGIWTRLVGQNRHYKKTGLSTAVLAPWVAWGRFQKGTVTSLRRVPLAATPRGCPGGRPGERQVPLAACGQYRTDWPSTETVSRPALVWRSVSYFESIVSANVAIAAPNLAGKAGPKEEGCAQGAGSCTAIRCSCPARLADDQSARRSLPAYGGPVAYSVALCRIYTSSHQARSSERLESMGKA